MLLHETNKNFGQYLVVNVQLDSAKTNLVVGRCNRAHWLYLSIAIIYLIVLLIIFDG